MTAETARIIPILCLPLPQLTVLLKGKTVGKLMCWTGNFLPTLHRPVADELGYVSLSRLCTLFLFTRGLWMVLLQLPWDCFDLRRSSISFHFSPLPSLMRYDLHYPIVSVQWVLVNLQLCKHDHSPIWEYFYHPQTSPIPSWIHFLSPPQPLATICLHCFYRLSFLYISYR